MADVPLTLRIVLLGDSEVGKTSLIQRFMRNQFENDQRNTVGAVLYTYEIKKEKKKIIFQIWDTAGQERYRSLGPIYYRNAIAAIAVFDMCKSSSLESLKTWIDDFAHYADNTMIFVVGNKTDKSESIELTEEEVRERCSKTFNAKCFFTSALTGMNVPELFKIVFDDVYTFNMDGFKETENIETAQPNEYSNCC